MLKKLAGITLGIGLTVGTIEAIHSFRSYRTQQSSLNLTISRSSQARNSKAPSLNELEELVFQQVNEYRIARGLRPLRLDPRISEQARIHSENIARGVAPFSHEGFRDRAKTIDREIPYRRAAENLAFNQGFANPAERAILGWIDSSGHRRNMEGDYELTGIGVAKNSNGAYYITQIFILQE